MAVRIRLVIVTVALPMGAGLLIATLPTSPATASAQRVRAEGALRAYDAAIPAGSTARVQAVATSSGKTVVTLHVRGLVPGTAYGAHAHTKACGALATDAGPHYQNQVAPVGHAADVLYANPDNEVWLDLTTDAEGNGSAQTVADWQFRAGGAGSVVIHRMRTATGPDGSAGTAGPRLACLSVPF